MMSMSKAIQDNNLLYNVLTPLVQFGCRCHYNSFTVRGLDNLPVNGAYIIAPCHQQALMEPLAVLNIAPKPPVFLARADIFKKPTFRAILTFLKIMPVYRIRDGQDQLGRNREVFDRCRDVLVDGFPLCLMAEGRHNNRHHLLPLGKGMFRIAGEAQLALGDHPLYIVPTGIDFDEYEQPYSNLVVNVGRPIAVQPFAETYRTNEPLALNQMRDTLHEALLPLMHDIRTDEHYEEVMTLCNVLNRSMRNREGLRNTAWNRFLVRQKISQRMDALIAAGAPEAERLAADAARFADKCRRLKIGEKTVAEHWSLVGTLLALLTAILPIAVAVIFPVVRLVLLFCLLCYPIMLIPTHLIIKRNIKDPQFRSSVNWGVRFFFSIAYTIVVAIVMACTGGGWMSEVADIGAWWGLVAVVVAHIEAIVSGPAFTFLRRTAGSLHYWLLRMIRPGAMRDIKATLDNLRIEV